MGVRPEAACNRRRFPISAVFLRGAHEDGTDLRLSCRWPRFRPPFFSCLWRRRPLVVVAALALRNRRVAGLDWQPLPVNVALTPGALFHDPKVAPPAERLAEDTALLAKLSEYGTKVDAMLATVSGQPERTALRLADFAADVAGRVTACPLGQAPESVRLHGERTTALFPAATCAACPQRPNCPVKRGKSHYRLVYTPAARRISLRRAQEETAEFRDVLRFRSGIEGTISQLDRRTGFKRLRVRGLARMRFGPCLKALGLNIRRVAALSGSGLPNEPGNRTPTPDSAATSTPVYALALLGRCWYKIFNEPVRTFRISMMISAGKCFGRFRLTTCPTAVYQLAG